MIDLSLPFPEISEVALTRNTNGIGTQRGFIRKDRGKKRRMRLIRRKLKREGRTKN